MQFRAIVVCFCASLLIAYWPGNTRAAPSCPYPGRLPDKQCTHNGHPHAILAGLGGGVLNSAGCSNDIAEALASLYSYNDVGCYNQNRTAAGGLKYIDDANSALPFFERNDKGHRFEGSIFCSLNSNQLWRVFI